MSSYMRLAACSMLTIFAITCSLSGGTLSQMLNASISLPRISFPGLEVMYLKGSSIDYKCVSLDWIELVVLMGKHTCSFSADHTGALESSSVRLSYRDILREMET